MTWIADDGDDAGRAIGEDEDEVPTRPATWVEFAQMPSPPPGAATDDHVPNMLARGLLHCDAEEAALAIQYLAWLAPIRARRNHWLWAYKLRAEAVVTGDLAAKNLGKSESAQVKSVHYPFGKCGWQASKRTDIEEGDATMDWAIEHCPEAIKTTTTHSLLKSALPMDKLKAGEIPGATRFEGDTFYIRPAAPKSEAQKAIEKATKEAKRAASKARKKAKKK